MTDAQAQAASDVATKSGPIADVVAWIDLLNGWGTIGLVLIAAFIAWFFWRLNSGSTPYRFGDTLIDPMTGKGSILRTAFLITLLVTLGNICYCVLVKQPVPTELVTVLGIVVAPMITGRYFETKDPRVVAQAEAMGPPGEGAPPSASADANLKTEVKT